VLARETYALDPEDHKMQALLRACIRAARSATTPTQSHRAAVSPISVKR
jgi:hypothetical protein